MLWLSLKPQQPQQTLRVFMLPGNEVGEKNGRKTAEKSPWKRKKKT